VREQKATHCFLKFLASIVTATDFQQADLIIDASNRHNDALGYIVVSQRKDFLPIGQFVGTEAAVGLFSACGGVALGDVRTSAGNAHLGSKKRTAPAEAQAIHATRVHQTAGSSEHYLITHKHANS
jgi:hypothetical protein